MLTGHESSQVDLAIFLPDLRGGGVEKQSVLLAEEAHKRDLRVELVLAQCQGEWLSSLPDGLTVEDLACSRLRATLPKLARYLRQVSPRALLARMWPLTGIAGLAARLARVPTRVVISEHNDFLAPARPAEFKERLIMRSMMPLLHRCADQVVANSEGVSRTVADLSRLDRKAIRVIHNPVEMEPSWLPALDDPSVTGWLKNQGPRLLAIGSFKPQKDFETAIRAFSLIREQRNAKLLILGEGSLRPSLEALIRELGLSGFVTLPGFRKNVHAYLYHADVFLASSAWEGFGNVIVEALSCGVQVASTDCASGPAEILSGGRFGRLVPIRDPEALARAVIESLDCPIDSGELKRRAQDFRPELIADEYLRVLGLLQPAGLCTPDLGNGINADRYQK